MEETKESLKHRKTLKMKKPSFIREGALKKKRLGFKWRKPKGLHSKMRLCFSGHRKLVGDGYRSPVSVKGLDRNGLRAVLVANIKELDKINKETECITIKKAVGLRKKIELLKKAKELSLSVSNIKDISVFLAEIEKKLKERKESKERKLKEQKEKEKARAEKKDEKKDKKEENKKETPDELAEKIKKEEEEQKKEKDKVLTKKE